MLINDTSNDIEVNDNSLQSTLKLNVHKVELKYGLLWKAISQHSIFGALSCQKYEHLSI